MGKKLQSNGLWESSRFIGPEFKEAIRFQQHEHNRIPRPVLDEQEIFVISGALMRSQIHQKNVQLTLYGDYQQRTVIGIVTRSQHYQFRLDTVDPISGGEEWEWINYKDVMKAELNKEWIEDEMVDP